MAYTITTTAGAHGMITPTATVDAGGNAAIDFLADAGYYVATVTVDGLRVSTAAPYAFINVLADHSISVIFAASAPQPLALPVLSRRNASQFQLSLVTNTQTFQSPLNKTVQTYELPGARWQLTATYSNLCEIDARIIKAWLLKLRGAAGRFLCGDLSHKQPRGKAIGIGSVQGGGQSGRSILTRWMLPLATCDSTILTADMTGFTVDAVYGNVPFWLLPGDYCNINGELKMITDISALDEAGHSTIGFEPPLRSVPYDGAAVIISHPTAVFRLADDQQDKFTWDPDRHPSVTISAVEVF